MVLWQENSGHVKFLSFPDTIISHFLILIISIMFYSVHIGIKALRYSRLLTPTTFWRLFHNCILHGETHKFLVSFSPSPEMPENEATFAITAGGIGDAKE